MTNHPVASLFLAAAASFASTAFAAGSAASQLSGAASAVDWRQVAPSQVAPSRTQAATEVLIARRNGTLRRAGESDEANVPTSAMSTLSRQQVKLETVQAALSRKLIPAGEGVGPMASATYGPGKSRIQVKEETRAARMNGTLIPAGEAVEGTQHLVSRSDLHRAAQASNVR